MEPITRSSGVGNALQQLRPDKLLILLSPKAPSNDDRDQFLRQFFIAMDASYEFLVCDRHVRRKICFRKLAAQFFGLFRNEIIKANPMSFINQISLEQRPGAVGSSGVRAVQLAGSRRCMNWWGMC